MNRGFFFDIHGVLCSEEIPFLPKREIVYICFGSLSPLFEKVFIYVRILKSMTDNKKIANRLIQNFEKRHKEAMKNYDPTPLKYYVSVDINGESIIDNEDPKKRIAVLYLGKEYTLETKLNLEDPSKRSEILNCNCFVHPHSKIAYENFDKLNPFMERQGDGKYYIKQIINAYKEGMDELLVWFHHPWLHINSITIPIQVVKNEYKK